MNKKEYVEQLIKDTNRTILEIERKKEQLEHEEKECEKKLNTYHKLQTAIHYASFIPRLEGEGLEQQIANEMLEILYRELDQNRIGEMNVAVLFQKACQNLEINPIIRAIDFTEIIDYLVDMEEITLGEAQTVYPNSKTLCKRFLMDK